MDENPVERARLYLDGFEDKNELQVGPYMLAWALQSLLEHHLATLPAEPRADDGAPTRHTLSAPAEPKPKPQDEAIGGLIERLNALAMAPVVFTRHGNTEAISGPPLEYAIALTKAASALSRLQVERDELRDVGRNMALQAERLLEALRDGGVTFDHQRAHASMVLAREVTAFRSILSSKRQQLTSSQSQPCSETGPNSPSSPQTPFSDGGGEP